MNAVRNLLRFLLVAAIGSVVSVVLLLQRSPCPCGRGAGVVVVPAARGELAVAGRNGTQQGGIMVTKQSTLICFHYSP
jgi:hypothetical protein